jgi:hypothetical protein
MVGSPLSMTVSLVETSRLRDGTKTLVWKANIRTISPVRDIKVDLDRYLGTKVVTAFAIS